MDKAREIITRRLREAAGSGESCEMKARWICEALTAAGYRIVGPGEVDAETVKTPADRFARWLEAGPRLAAALSYPIAPRCRRKQLPYSGIG